MEASVTRPIFFPSNVTSLHHPVTAHDNSVADCRQVCTLHRSCAEFSFPLWQVSHVEKKVTVPGCGLAPNTLFSTVACIRIWVTCPPQKAEELWWELAAHFCPCSLLGVVLPSFLTLGRDQFHDKDMQWLIKTSISLGMLVKPKGEKDNSLITLCVHLCKTSQCILHCG